MKGYLEQKSFSATNFLIFIEGEKENYHYNFFRKVSDLVCFDGLPIMHQYVRFRLRNLLPVKRYQLMWPMFL